MKKDVVDALCEPPVVLGAALVTAAALVRRNAESAACIAVATPVAVGVSKLLKYVVDEHRPRLFDKKPEQSFPSGHSAAVAAYALSIVATTRRWWLLPLAGLAIAAVNVSRVREREHWPRDVLAGDAIGVVGLLAGVAAGRLVRARSAARARRRGSAAD